MKITILQGAFFPVPPILGGAVEKMWFRLGQEFAARGNRVTHISRAHPELPGREEIGGVQHVRVRGSAQPPNGVVLKTLDLLYSLRAVRQVPCDSDVVVTNTFWSPALLPNDIKPRVCVSVERMPKGQMRLYARAGRLRANSSPVADAIRAELPVCRHNGVVMVPNPLPFGGDDAAGTIPKENKILYCGRVHPEKGIERLIEAAARLGSDAWPVEVVGPWSTAEGGGGEAYRDALRAQAATRGARIAWIGPVFEEAALRERYARAAIFVYPSVAEKGETFGLAPLEAMAHGSVPVVSNLACFRDFIRHGENGCVFDHRVPDPAGELAGTLRELQKSPELRNRLAMEAVKVNQSHAPSRIAERFLEIFEDMRLQGGGPRET